LILFRDEALLGKLACIRPSHKSWLSCVQKLASLVHDESFIESHAKLHAPLDTRIQYPGEHIPETSFDPKKEIYTLILQLVTALDYSNNFHTELGSSTSQFVPLRRVQSNADKEKYGETVQHNEYRTSDSGSMSRSQILKPNMSSALRLWFTQKSCAEDDCLDV